MLDAHLMTPEPGSFCFFPLQTALAFESSSFLVQVSLPLFFLRSIKLCLNCPPFGG
jgi:hypothetical protein